MRPPSPRVLAAAGFALLVAAGIWAVVWQLTRPHPHAAQPTTTTAPPTTTAPATTTAPPTTTAPQPGVTATRDGVTIRDARVSSTTPFAATVTWATEPATSGRVAAALGNLPPTLWSPAEPLRTTHSVTLGGLAFGSSYTLTVTAAAADGRTVEVSLPVQTPRPDPTHVIAAAANGAVTLDGQPFFPLMIYGECPPGYGPAVTAGVDLVAANPCGGAAAAISAVAGAALVAGDAGSGDTSEPGAIGWFLPDEADARGMTADTLPATPASGATGRLTFLTLSNHVFSLASPPPGGRDVYPGLIARADVVGLDLYPLQTMCWPDRIGAVYDAQRELERLAGGKPTFQWIETATMSCPATGPTAITGATVRAESWLAVAGGAAGLGFFPAEWLPEAGAAIAEVTTAVKATAPALLAPEVATSATGDVCAAVHELNGALYVVLANPARRSASATIRLAALGNRTLQPLDGGAPLHAGDGSVRVTLPPLGGSVYVAAPS